MGLLNKKKNKPKVTACKTKNKTNKTTASKTTTTNKKQPTKRSNTTAKATAQKNKTNTRDKNEKIYPRDEFRKNKVTGHPAHIEGHIRKLKKEDDEYLYRGITHKDSKSHPKIKLSENPNPEDKTDAYISRKQSRQKTRLFSKEVEKNWKLSPEDRKKLK